MIIRIALVPTIALMSGFLSAAALDSQRPTPDDDYLTGAAKSGGQEHQWLDDLWECPDDHYMVTMYDNEKKQSFTACFPFVRATPRKE